MLSVKGGAYGGASEKCNGFGGIEKASVTITWKRNCEEKTGTAMVICIVYPDPSFPLDPSTFRT